MRRAIDAADAVLTSELSVLEVERALIRAVAVGQLTDADVTRMRAIYARGTAGWTVVPLSSEVWDAARKPFPREPVRALDSLHLAALVVLRTAVPDLGVLSLDDRVRENARLLGFKVVP